MKINVKGHIRDLLAFRGLVSKRRKTISRSSTQPLGPSPVNVLAGRLHPEAQGLVIREVREESATTRTFILGPDPGSGPNELAYFRAGQYLSLKVDVDGTSVTRPYSIASAPHECLGADGYYQLTMKRVSDGFVTPYVWDHWRAGTHVEASGPWGVFHHEPLRDTGKIVGLAGGSGITPFLSMAREIVHGGLDVDLLLLYGSSDQDDIVFYEELKQLEASAPARIRIVHVLSCEEVTLEGCEQGFITAEAIEKYADLKSSTFFICGPRAMYEFVGQELEKLHLPRRRIRRELSGPIKEVTQAAAFPSERAGQDYQLRVHIGGATEHLPARADETILVAMERAKLVPPSRCRSGECGFCRSLLLSGEVYIYPDGDGRRAADRQFGYIHPCSSYPMTDLELAITRGG